MTNEVKVLSDDEVARIQKQNQYDDGLIISPEIDALCATVRALRASDKRTHTPSIVEALRLLDDAGYGKEVPNSLSDMIKKVLAERDDLLNRSHQTVIFECGCVFRQDGLDAEPQLVEHCTLWAEMERNAMIETIAESEKENTALREQLAELRIALQPFAALDVEAFSHLRDKSDDREIYKMNDTVITVGDVRKARALLQQEQP